MDASIATSLQQPLVIEGQSAETWPIEERMRKFSVPGVSVAVIDDYQVAAAAAWSEPYFLFANAANRRRNSTLAVPLMPWLVQKCGRPASSVITTVFEVPSKISAMRVGSFGLITPRRSGVSGTSPTCTRFAETHVGGA